MQITGEFAIDIELLIDAKSVFDVVSTRLQVHAGRSRAACRSGCDHQADHLQQVASRRRERRQAQR
eukprot:9468752-Heterocapsa_arctica.AAC.1